MAAIFVSYRREDSAGHAGRLFDQLKQHFGQKNVFWDVSGSIEPGEPFDDAIERAVTSCDALLAIIGPTWVTSADAEGKRRIDDPDDFVRLEISKALRRNVRVVPVLVHRARMPRAEELPENLQPLARHQAIELSDSRWDYDASQLIRSLERKIGHPASRRWLGRPIAVAAAVVLLVAGGVGLWVIPARMDPPADRVQADVTRMDGTIDKEKLEALLDATPGTEFVKDHLMNAQNVGDLRTRLGRVSPETLEDMARNIEQR